MNILSFLFGKPKEKKYSKSVSFNINGSSYETTISVNSQKNKRQSNPNSRKKQTILPDEIVIDIDDFIDKYMGCIPINLFILLQNESIDGYNQSVIKKSVLDKIIKVKDKQEKEGRILERVAELNNQGNELEKEGKIEEAIYIYEENIKHNYPATHSYNRLMVLYRKTKQKDKEIRIIKKAIKLFSKKKYTNEVEKWEKRLERLEK